MSRFLGETGQRLVSVFQRLFEVTGGLVRQRDLPVSVSDGCRVRGEFPGELPIHCQLLLRILFIGDGLQLAVFWRARRNHDFIHLSFGWNRQEWKGKNNQQQRPDLGFHRSPPSAITNRAELALQQANPTSEPVHWQA